MNLAEWRPVWKGYIDQLNALFESFDDAQSVGNRLAMKDAAEQMESVGSEFRSWLEENPRPYPDLTARMIMASSQLLRVSYYVTAVDETISEGERVRRLEEVEYQLAHLNRGKAGRMQN